MKDAPEFFECSSLAAWAAVEAGYAIPRVSIDQFVFAKRIGKEDLLPGDMIFANTEEIVHTEGMYYSQVLGKEVHEEPIRYETLEYLPGTKVPHGVDHVGIYIGDNKLIHGTSKRGEVVEEDMNESPSFQNIVGYGRIVEEEAERFVVEIPDDRPDLRSKENLIEFINHA
ncbi:MAG: phenylalanyl-tRNA synthetase subunit beta, phenylalanyl-tRNA synthetase beta chain [Parcubacteria group bacterium]|nr:phenylalanyl-tRNA synthetase subunit beta, phenylalanyl-tRNA synthetase beta chain [Parcubacteria group bacterium]